MSCPETKLKRQDLARQDDTEPLLAGKVYGLIF